MIVIYMGIENDMNDFLFLLLSRCIEKNRIMMSISGENGKYVFVKRVMSFVFVNIFLLSVIVLRLLYLQVYKANHYKLLSDKNRIVISRVLPDRGEILDRSGIQLATNKPSYSVVFDFSEANIKNIQSDINCLITSAHLDDNTIEELQSIIDSRRFKNKSVLVQENLSWSDLSFFSSLSAIIPGIVVRKSITRHYHFPEIFSHVIGYTGSPTKQNIEDSGNSVLTLPMAKIGKTCVEKSYDRELFGTVGIRQIEVNSRREQVKLLENIESIPGKTIFLTIDKILQEKVYEILSKQESATCIVMDVNTGEILAFVSYPGYDTNIFNSKINSKVLSELYSNPYKPMINKALTGLYAPGSAFKMITTLAALSAGTISSQTRFSCGGFYELGKHKFHCWRWKYGGHGSLNAQQAIERSCDVFFYNIARTLNPDVIAKTANDFGLGIPTGIDLPGEKSGLIPTQRWKKNNKKQSWTTGDNFNMSIGQGFVLTTPIQLVKMVAMLVNGQKQIMPHVVKQEIHRSDKKLYYNQEHIDLLDDGMFDVVNGGYGTARNASIDDDFLIAGKTGSSQVCRITEKQRQMYQTVSDDYWKKEHALFVGYAPADAPQYAICVLVEHGGSGAKTAVPIAREVFLALKDITRNDDEDNRHSD